MIEHQKNEILIYQAEDGSAVTEVRLGEETVWLSQVQIAELFGRERSVITKHINNVFKEGELEKESNVQNLHIAGHGILYQASGGKRIADNALVALTLLIAESRPVEKDTIVKAVINLINGNNQG